MRAYTYFRGTYIYIAVARSFLLEPLGFGYEHLYHTSGVKWKPQVLARPIVSALPGLVRREVCGKSKPIQMTKCFRIMSMHWLGWAGIPSLDEILGGLPFY